ncbi:hypothetical protein SAMN02745121_03091 [Nannocystis exedens]|uniref:Uncharacterized protein n=1 Tax=Nannocystis exedens TaxID=54 RepID=A0A1I1Y043_9BACT|nr:hypothetical protein NAEX_04817 [Nannocystis exedens]SFE13055.1 hypothetical protein SAMN02745121_03091 [Nannocystis exedens]
MRHTGLAARMIFAERFTAAVIDRPFYAGLKMVATRPRVTEPTVVAPAEPEPVAPMPRAA